MLRRLIVSSCLCFIFATIAKADSITFSLSSNLTCGRYTDQCTQNANGSVTFGSGANTLTLAFIQTTHNFSDALVPGVSYRMILGRINATVSGTGFTFPDIPPVQTQPHLLLTFTQTEPFPTTVTIATLFFFGTMSETENNLTLRAHYPAGDVTAGRVLINGIVFSIVYFVEDGTLPLPIDRNGTTELEGGVTVTPEPATIVLIASGLGALLLRRRITRRSPGI